MLSGRTRHTRVESINFFVPDLISAQKLTNHTEAVDEWVNSRFLVLPGILLSLLRLLRYNILVYYDLAVNYDT